MNFLFKIRAPGRFFWGTLALACGLSACKDGRETARAEPVPAPPSAGLRWAKSLDWERRDSGIRLVVSRPWKDAREALSYDLVSAGSPGASASAIRLPVRRIACLSSVHVGFLRALNATGALIAVDEKGHIYDGSVRAGIEAGRILQVGSGSQVNVERLLAAKPDLVLANAVGISEYEALKRLRQAGIPVLITAEWMEDHPLARAEWLRLFGLLLGREQQADSLFRMIEASYLEQAEQARGRARKPTILLGGPFRDQWFVSGGRSFMARFLADAGGDYLWKSDTTAGGVPLSFETVLTRARAADVWLHPGDWRDWRDLSAGLKRDARFAAFSAFRRGEVYNSDARRLPDGANDYLESGLVNPQRVLADLVSIFHGGGDSLYYYRRLPPVR